MLNKCERCKEDGISTVARYSYGGEHFCKKHYLAAKFNGAKSVYSYCAIRKVPFMRHAIRPDLLVFNPSKADIIELAELLNLDYYFGQGVLGKVDMSNYLFVEDKPKGEVEE